MNMKPTVGTKFNGGLIIAVGCAIIIWIIAFGIGYAICTTIF
jgi:hypothetical protein